jgi:putative DeoR family transcriptional regulator (stage III sporulation protein D)
MKYYSKIVTSISDRAILYGNYIVSHDATVRETAKAYGVGKSGVHTSVTEHLRHADPKLYGKVQKVLAKHAAMSHILGGEVIRQRYANK